MNEIQTLVFRDVASDEEGVLIVRASGGSIGLTVSLKSDGDIEVFLSPQDCTNLLQGLQRALEVASRN